MRWCVGVVMCAALCVGLATSAQAQSSGPSRSLTVAGSLGYSFVRTLGDDKANLPVGWAASIDATLNGRFAVVVDFASARQSGTAAQVPGARRLNSIQAGGRVFLRAPGARVSPFVQFLAGKARIVQDGDRFFSVQPGVGADITIVSHVGVRLQADYVWIRRPADPLTGFRIVAGVVIR